jgi:hypothetical protein
VWAPQGTEVDVELTAVVTATVAGIYKFQCACDEDGSPIAPMGGLYLPANQPTAGSLRGQLSKITPGFYRTFYIGSMCPSGGTLHCRPVAQAGIEAATTTWTDIAYRPV